MTNTEYYREMLERWRATAPANDHDILPASRPSQSPRHAALSSELAVLLRWKAFRNPETELRTNWSVQPANDDVPGVSSHERTREVFPSEGAMIAALQGVEFEERTDIVLLDGQPSTRTRTVPIGGDMDRGTERYAKKPLKSHKWAPVTRLGDLQFSELHYNKRQKQLQPLGSLTHCNGQQVHERLGRAHQAKVPSRDVAASNQHVADIMDTPLPRYVPGNRRKRGQPPKYRCVIDTTSMTFAEARAFYGLPPVERDPHPVLPAASRDIAGQFVGMRIGMDRSPPPDLAATPHEVLEQSETLTQILAAMSPQDVKVLDIAITAPNFREVGEAFGSSDKVAERRGKRLVLAAAKNLDEVLKKMAA